MLWAVKVLVVGTGGSLSGSGITTAADQMVRTLREMDYDAERLVAGDRSRARPNRLNPENLLAVLGEAVAAARRTRAIRADVVWLHTFGVPTLPALRTAAQVLAVRMARSRVIVEFHAFGLERFVSDAGWLQRVTLRAIGRWTAAIVVLHEAAASALRSVVGDANVVVLPNWVDVPTEPAPMPPAPPWRAVFVGALTRRKGAPQLVEAMQLLDDVPLVLRLVGGPGDEGPEIAEEVRRSATRLVSEGRIELAGPEDAASVRRSLAESHLFVLPSSAEGMPIAMLEAMAEGRPVLVTDVGNMATVVSEAGCGWVLSSSEPQVIAAGLRDAVAQPAELEARGRAGHAVARQRFSDASQRARLEQLLDPASVAAAR